MIHLANIGLRRVTSVFVTLIKLNSSPVIILIFFFFGERSCEASSFHAKHLNKTVLVTFLREVAEYSVHCYHFLIFLMSFNMHFYQHKVITNE